MVERYSGHKYNRELLAQIDELCAVPLQETEAQDVPTLYTLRAEDRQFNHGRFIMKASIDTTELEQFSTALPQIDQR